MKFFLAVFVLVAAVTAAEEYTTDRVLDDAVVNKFSWNHIPLRWGTPYTLPLPNFKSAIDDKIIAFIEDARDKFDVGFPELGIPPLDPLAIENFHIHLFEKLIVDLQIDFDDILIVGLKQFVIDNFTFKVVGLTAEFQVTLPRLILGSLYRMDGKVASIIPFHPSGDASVDMQGLTLGGVATLGVTNDGYLSMKGFAATFDIEKLKIELSGILGDGVVNSLFNWVLSRISETVIQAEKEKIQNAASDYIVNVANEFLKEIKLSDIIG